METLGSHLLRVSGFGRVMVLGCRGRAVGSLTMKNGTGSLSSANLSSIFVFPLGSKDSYLKAFGPPKTILYKAFLAILSLRVWLS